MREVKFYPFIFKSPTSLNVPGECHFLQSKNPKVYKDTKAEKAANRHNGCAAKLQTFTLHYCEGQTMLLLTISC